MKLANRPAFSFNSKRWSTIALLGVMNILPVSASLGQNISVQVNNYIKTPVKEAALSGTILVAENMIDWFSETKAAPAAPKKIVKRVTGKPSVAAPALSQAVVKAKCPPVAKAVKRP